MKHLVRLTLSPLNTAPDPQITLTEMQRILTEIASGSAPTSALPWQEIEELATSDSESLGGSAAPAEAAGGQLKPLVEEKATSPSAAAPNAAETSASVEASGVQSLEPLAPAPAAAAPVPAVPPPAVPGVMPPPPAPAAPAPAAVPSGLPAARVAEPPSAPVAPGPYEPPVIGDMPVVRQPKMPPLPLNHFPRLEPTALRDYISQYQSTDFQLQFRDLGYVYPSDVPGVPPVVNDTPAGTFTAPVLKGAAAESYFVEEEKRQPKPSFEGVKTRVYSTWRKVEMDKQVQQTYRKALSEASVSYSF
jgi:hypothetical protein